MAGVRIPHEKKQLFIDLWRLDRYSMSELCRIVGISRPSGIRLRDRYLAMGEAGLLELSHTPKNIPRKLNTATRNKIIGLRKKYPGTGPETLSIYLAREGLKASPSSIYRILKEKGLIRSNNRRGSTRMNLEIRKNEVWEICPSYVDITGEPIYFSIPIVDIGSQFVVAFDLAQNIQPDTITSLLKKAMKAYGKPKKVLINQETPFWTAHSSLIALMELSLTKEGIELVTSRKSYSPIKGRFFCAGFECGHPKNRDYRSYKEAKKELLEFIRFHNFERPLRSLNLMTPAEKYLETLRPETVERLERQGLKRTTRAVQKDGRIYFQGQKYPVGRELAGKRVKIDFENNSLLILYKGAVIGKHYIRR
ncbi:MAG: hypothetical protein QMD08_01850 [Actinomycetota bacterium]|nr:hypothetical protein [Actinomycetota bacterium]